MSCSKCRLGKVWYTLEAKKSLAKLDLLVLFEINEKVRRRGPSDYNLPRGVNGVSMTRSTWNLEDEKEFDEVKRSRIGHRQDSMEFERGPEFTWECEDYDGD
ncbi:hypothetical protein Tco_1408262 [Tanacetum coccineum]